jgi:hypothetical protein
MKDALLRSKVRIIGFVGIGVAFAEMMRQPA